MKQLTIEQVAGLAGVSRGTVSRVLNDHPSVRPAVRRRVLQVIDEHNYSPRTAARSLASNRTNMVALLIPRTTDAVFAEPYYAYSMQGVAEASARHGYFVTLSMVTGVLQQGFMQALRGGHFAGVVAQAGPIDDPVLPQVLKSGIPLVQVGRHPYLQNLSWVDVEGREGARTAVAHLIGLGHRRIGAIAGPAYHASALDRRDGYKQALLEADLAIDSALIVEANWTQAGGYAAMARLLGLDTPPTAVFVASDLMATGALRALDEAGRSLPDDMAIVGFDDLPLAAFTSPPLTSMRQPIYEIGAAAADVLVERIAAPDRAPQQVSFPAALVVRQSCGAASRPGPGVEAGASPLDILDAPDDPIARHPSDQPWGAAVAGTVRSVSDARVAL